MPPASLRGNKLRDLVKYAVGRLRIKNGDVILIKRTSPLNTKDDVTAFADALGRKGFDRSTICIVEDFTDLTTLDEEAMRSLGWQRVPDAEKTPAPTPETA